MFARHDTPREGRRSRLSITLVVLLLVALGVLGATSGVAAATPQAAGMWLSASSPVRTGKSLSVSGGITAAADLSGETVNIYKREMGENADTLVAQPTVTTAPWGNVFQATLAGLKHSSILTATWAGNADYLPSRLLDLRPRASEGDAGSSAHHRQVPQATVHDHAVPASGRADVSHRQETSSSCSRAGLTVSGSSWAWPAQPPQMGSHGYRPPTTASSPGTYVLRARFVGSDYNAPAVSKTLRVAVP